MKTQSIDLHVHSNRSDGRQNIKQIEKTAKRKKLIVALADHDEIPPPGTSFITAIELGCYRGEPTHCRQSLHILGYKITPEKIQPRLNLLVKSRWQDAAKIKQSLERTGLEVNGNALAQKTRGQPPRHFHFSGIIVQNPNNAILLKKLSPDQRNVYPILREIMIEHVSRDSVLSPKEAISLIVTAGGFPVIAHAAHPFDGWPTPNNPFLLEFIEEMRPLGLAGIECFSPHHPRGIAHGLARIAENFDLAITAGTDFHGRPGEEIGMLRFKGNPSSLEMTTALLNKQARNMIFG